MCSADLLTFAKDILKVTSFFRALVHSCIKLIIEVYQSNIR